MTSWNPFAGRGASSRQVAILIVLALGLPLAACGPSEMGEEKQASNEAAKVAPMHGSDASDAYEDDNDNIDDETREKGQAIYDEVCASCHETGLDRAPDPFIIGLMTPESIYRAMTEGVMQVNAEGLSDDEKITVAEFVSGRTFGGNDESFQPLMCEADPTWFDRGQPPAFTGWGLDPASTHSVSTELAGISRENVGTLKLKWALAYPNAVRARSQPTLAGGAIYVGSHDGTVFALDRDTGCARWTFPASAEVRTGIVVSPWEAGDQDAAPLIYFGDLVGNTYGVNAVTGELVWRVHMEDHPNTTLTGTPSLHDGTLYVPVSSLEEGAASEEDFVCCTFRGSLQALDAATGALKWQTYLIDVPATVQGKNKLGIDKFGPSGVPVWNSPAIDVKRGQFYVTTGDNYSQPATGLSDSVIAIDMETGKINWSYQALEGDVWNGACEQAHQINCPEDDGPDFDFGAGAVLATGRDGKDYVLAGQKSGEAYGIDPDTGKMLWKKKVGRGGVNAGIHFGLAAVDGVVFVPVSDVPDGNEYDMPAQPGMYALDIATGEYIWRAPSENICEGRRFCHPGYSAAVTATPELLFAGANDGFIRIYDVESGDVLWEMDIVRDFTAVNGATARGGSVGGGTGPIVHDGLLMVNSGYGFAGKMPGNVMLVFEVER